MATVGLAPGEVPLDPKRDRLVIVASSLGTMFEWYDFFLYGILASLLGKLFFTTGNPTTELLFSLFAFGIGAKVTGLGLPVVRLLVHPSADMGQNGIKRERRGDQGFDLAKGHGYLILRAFGEVRPERIVFSHKSRSRRDTGTSYYETYELNR